MCRLIRRIFRFGKADDGPTAVEYALVLALIIIICINGLFVLGRIARRPFISAAAQLR